MIDLHCHSTASDGLLPPEAVVEEAAARGLQAIALTDHDTTAGVGPARSVAVGWGVEVISGCEFSVATPWGEMHLLGYFIEPGDEGIEQFLAVARSDRERRMREMVARLTTLGVAIDLAQVLAVTQGGAAGRPHVARALHQLGAVSTVQQAFDRYIGRGRPAFVEKRLPPFRAVAALVHAKGGVVSAAHLKYQGTQANLAHLKGEGLDAVETRHPSHNPDCVAMITDAALALDLARTGGSDWHGERDPSGTHAALGSQQIPDEWLDRLRERCESVA